MTGAAGELKGILNVEFMCDDYLPFHFRQLTCSRIPASTQLYVSLQPNIGICRWEALDQAVDFV
jgi:hypothetical protein